jgi:hypothetical protein
LARRPHNRNVLEEYEDNEPTDVEFDPESEAIDVKSPYDPKLIRVDPKVYSVRQILDMINDRELDLAPDFQRRRVWKPRQKSLLIESLLLRIPLPAFYFSADADGLLQVVDGVQRLSTIFEFVQEDSLSLDHLEYLGDELFGMTYQQLKGSLWARRILNTQISANVIDPQTPIAVKFDIFRRINTGGSPLNSQEIRHCMSHERSRAFLKDLCESPNFIQAVGPKIVNHVRMVDRELALRYAAFKLLNSISQFHSYTSMEDFLTEMNRKIDDPKETSDRDLSRLSTQFDRSMGYAFELFGLHAFRKWPEGDEHIFPINRALFDVWSVALSRIAEQTVREESQRIVRRARRLMKEDDPFISAISTGTSSPRKVVLRFERVERLLSG